MMTTVPRFCFLNNLYAVALGLPASGSGAGSSGATGGTTSGDDTAMAASDDPAAGTEAAAPGASEADEGAGVSTVGGSGAALSPLGLPEVRSMADSLSYLGNTLYDWPPIVAIEELRTLSIAASSCPEPEFTWPPFGTFKMTFHCQFLADYGEIIRLFAIAFWTLAAIREVFAHDRLS